MALLFETKPGSVVAVAEAGDTPMFLRVDGWGGYAGFKAIITEMSVALATNHQMQHTLKDLVYIYAFGDRIGQLRVAGMAFAGACEDPSAPGGVENVLRFYKLNKLSNRATPSQIQLGVGMDGHFQGYLHTLKIDVFKPEARISQFGLTYDVFPESRGTPS